MAFCQFDSVTSPVLILNKPYLRAVKITPAHDQADFEAGKRHNLKTLQVIDEGGNLTPSCGEFSGLPRFDARDIITSHLDKLGLFRGRQAHPMIVPICSRSRDVVELLVRPQWFVKCDEMAARALEDVKKGRLSIEPEHFEKTWFNWLENIRISHNAESYRNRRSTVRIVTMLFLITSSFSPDLQTIDRLFAFNIYIQIGKSVAVGHTTEAKPPLCSGFRPLEVSAKQVNKFLQIVNRYDGLDMDMDI
ncbi:hypothetical protein NQ317_011369 [Molorchus minor]|uniref:valine--tRNA ligase n=1 Tax=Molorchus minor TaxID=1323400 RepID=A0ABQ9JD62_9CUCU|nr:hypothetical protein NQ317_011369 [Molorchus minor]